MPSTIGIVAGSRDDFTPLQYSPYRWYDMSDFSTFTYSSSGGAYIGPNGYTSFRIAGNFATVDAFPDFGDVDIICQASLANWSAALRQGLASSGSEGYLWPVWDFMVDTGALRFRSTSSVEPVEYSRALPTWTNNSTHWVRVRREQSTGLITFFEGDDGIVWRQLGASIAGFSGPVNPNAFIGGKSTRIGSDYAQGNQINGSIQRVIVWNGDSTSSGTKVMDVDFTLPTSLFRNQVFETVSGRRISMTSSTSVAGASGALVRRVDDKSGNGRHVFRPEGEFIYMPHVAGGEIVNTTSLYFDGGDAIYENTQLNAPITTFVVFRRTGTGAGAYLFDNSPSYLSNRSYLYTTDGFSNWSNGAASLTFSDSGRRTIAENYQGVSAGYFSLDNSYSPSGTPPSSTHQGITLMARYSSTESMTGYLCEFLQFGDLSFAQRRIVRNYLRAKWNVSE